MNSKPAAITRRLGWLLRCLADRIDYAGAPRATHWTFTFEPYLGVVFREDGKGCRLWYLGDDDYGKAHSEANDPDAPTLKDLL